MEIKKKRKQLSSFQIIIFGFMGVILAGALLLMLPIASKGAGGTPFIDSLFTATSAVCVTGLIVHDTATYWTLFGQTVIICLIQIGGLGVVTIAVAITMISGRKIGLMQRSTMQEAISAPTIAGVVKLTTFILKGVFFFEALGAVLMAPVFCKEFGWIKGIWYACFHSISAFCNAGFDLMGVREPCSSLTSFAGNPLINFVIMALIVIGGIGFLTWQDVLVHKTNFHKYRMQSKIVIIVSALLIFVPALYFYVCEFSKSYWDFASAGDKVWYALFQSVTVRTAGFNTVDLAKLGEPAILLMICLMIIGGSPGSTAGGIKTTTFAVLLGNCFSVFLRKEDTNFFGRRIAPEAVKEAGTILMLYLVLFLLGTMVISSVEEVPVLTAMFEAGSAIATVGLTLGITAKLHFISKVILIFLMFMGRVGGLTLIFAALSRKRRNLSRMPEEKITVG